MMIYTKLKVMLIIILIVLNACVMCYGIVAWYMVEAHPQKLLPGSRLLFGIIGFFVGVCAGMLIKTSAAQVSDTTKDAITYK